MDLNGQQALGYTDQILSLRRLGDRWRAFGWHVAEVDGHDAEAVTRVVSQIRPDWIFHLAAYGAYSWQTDWEQMVQTNIQSTMSLLNASLQTGFEAFVNTGSSSEYGFKDHAPAESEPVEPNSHYAVTKAAATMFCRYAARNRRVHLPILRLYSVFGTYEDPGWLSPI